MMPTTVVDPGAGALAQAIGNLGSGIAKRVFERRIREDNLRQDPQAVQQLIPVMQAAVGQGEGAVKALSDTLGVRESFVLDAVEGFSLTPQQRTAEVTADVTERGGRALLESGVPEQRVDVEERELNARAARAEVDTEIANAFIEENLAKLQAQALREGAQFDALNAEFQTGLLKFNMKNGIAEATLNQELLEAQVGLDAAKEFVEYIDSLPFDSDERIVALAGLSGSGAAGALASMRNADLSALLRQAVTRQTTEEEIVTLTLELRERMNEAVDRLVEAEEGGRDKDFIEQAKQDVENMRLLIGGLMEQDRILPIDLVGAEGSRGKIELTFEDVESAPVQALLQAAVEEFNSGTSIQEVRQGLIEVQGQLSKRDREALQTQLPGLLAEMTRGDIRFQRKSLTIPGMLELINNTRGVRGLR